MSICCFVEVASCCFAVVYIAVLVLGCWIVAWGSFVLLRQWSLVPAPPNVCLCQVIDDLFLFIFFAFLSQLCVCI